MADQLKAPESETTKRERIATPARPKSYFELINERMRQLEPSPFELAGEFVRQKWGMKAIHRLIVTSATYRQSSHVPRSLYESGPYNRLLAHGPRFRKVGEMVRDNALVISGLLSRKIGGPSVFPYRPDAVWNNPYGGDKWVTSTGGDHPHPRLIGWYSKLGPTFSPLGFDPDIMSIASCLRDIIKPSAALIWRGRPLKVVCKDLRRLVYV